MSGTPAQQRLVSLDVDEVSLVGVPANEEPFVVTKSKTQESAVAGVTLDPLVAQEVTLNSLQNLVWEVGRDLSDPAKRDAAMAKLERAHKMIDQVKQFTAAVTKAAAEIPVEVQKAKDGDKDKKVPAFMKAELSKLLDVIKAAMGEDEEEDEDAKTTKALATVATLKAGKAQFSKERLSKLDEAFKHLGEMYKGADESGFTKAIESWTAKPASGKTDSGSATQGGGPTGPNTAQPQPATPANGSVNKSGEEAPAWFTAQMASVTKALDEVKGATSAVAARVEAVEKTEAVSKALTQGTDGKPVEKQGSIWKGIL
jgi:hypothetical protein